MQNSQHDIGRAIGMIGSSAVDAYRNTEAAKLIGNQQENVSKDTEKKGYENVVLDRTAGKINSEIDINKQEVENRKEMGRYIQANTSAAKARAGLDAEVTNQYSKSGMPGYGLGERLIRSIDAPGVPQALPPNSWPFN